MEQHATALGFEQVALGVDIENTDAQRLYERRGYRLWPHGVVTSSWTALDDTGTERTYTEDLNILVKSLYTASTH